MITVSNIRAKNTAVHGWYEADLHDDEYGDDCVGRWYFSKPDEVELYSHDGGLIGHINRTIDPEAVNVLEAFVAHHSASEREADEKAAISVGEADAKQAEKITLTKRKVNKSRRLFADPVWVEVPCFEKDGKFYGDVPESWDIALASRAVQIANAWMNGDRAPYEECSDVVVRFMARELVSGT